MSALDDFVVGGIPDERQKRQQQALRGSLIQADTTPPDEYAEATQLSRTLNISPDVVSFDLPAFKLQNQLQSADALAGTKTGAALTDPHFAKLARDDTDILLQLEAADRLPEHHALLGIADGFVVTGHGGAHGTP